MKKNALLLSIAITIAGCGGSESSAPNQAMKSPSKWLHRSEKTTAIVASDYATSVQDLYVAYFGRPADPNGLINFENALLAANAPTDIQQLSAAYSTNPKVKALIDSFETSTESVALYGNSSAAVFVSSIYQNVLGRAPEQSGLNFWVNAINSGSLTQGDAAISIMAGGLANTTAQGMLDGKLINNRLTVAANFTSQVLSANAVNSYSGAPAAAFARQMLSNVNATTDTIAFGTIVNSDVAILAKTKPRTNPVFNTSYENKNWIALDNPQGPNIGDVSNIVLEPGEQGFSERPIAWADFQQNGTYQAIAVSSMYKGIYGAANPTHDADSPGKIYFLNRDPYGNWTDITSTLIKDLTTRYTCITPTFIQIGDINNDGKPDALIGCTGVDFTIVGATSAQQNTAWLSLQYEVLSQPDGSYIVQAINVEPIYGHEAALADIDGDGNLDIVSVDPNGNGTPVVLWGRGDGTFTLDATRFPADMKNQPIYGVTAVPINGQVNVIISGNSNAAYAATDGIPSNYGYGTKVLQYNGAAFSYIADFTSSIPHVTSVPTLQYGFAFDAIYDNGFYYFTRASQDYSSFAIVKTNAVTGASATINEYVPNGKAGPPGTIKLTSKNDFVNQSLDCSGVSLTDNTNWIYNVCSLSVPLQ